MMLIRRCILIGTMIGTIGCQAGRRPSQFHASTRPVPNAKPLIEFAKGAGGFPLTGDTLPATIEELRDSLEKGYAARVELRKDNPSVLIDADDAGDPNHIKQIRVDLTDAKVNGSYRPGTFSGTKALEPGPRVDFLEYVAAPIQYATGRTNLRITAHDTQLALLKGKNEGAVLVMTEATDGEAFFHVALSDLYEMLRASAKAHSRAGFSVADVKTSLSSKGLRSLSAEVHVNGMWFVVPAKLKFTGRIDIDSDFNAHLSNVACTGEDVGGKLLAEFVDSGLRKYDGKVVPLANFPGGKIQLRDLRIRLDDSLRIYAAFSS